MRIRAFVVAAVLVVGCKKEKGPPPAPAPKAPVSTAEQDALWKLAPDGTVAGIVLSSRGVASLESGWLAVRSLITTAPELAPAAAEMEKQLTKIFGSSNVKLADVGMVPGKGAALFGLEKGAEVAIIPVIDRDKFLAVTKGTKGTDHDTIEDHVCKTVQNVYACAKPPELLDRLGKARDVVADSLKLAGARGDIEVAGTIPDASHPVTFAAVGQVDRGAIVVRGAVKGVPDMVTSKLKASGKQTVDATKASGFAVLNFVPVLADVNLQSATTPPAAPGVTVNELITNVDGPVTIAIPSGAMVFDVRIPMKDTGPAQKLVEQCDQSPWLQMLGAKVESGVCHMNVPQMQMQLDMWVEGKELRIGKKGAPAPATVAPTAIASELAQGEWAFAMFGRGTLLGEGQFPAMPMGALPDEAKMGLRIMMFLNEIGLGVRADGDTVRFLASARTAWSNPDDVVAKIIAISPDQVVTGKAAAAAKEIANSAPNSPFAGDFKAGLGGVMIPAAAVGILAAVAIPAFMDYTKKSKRSEASVELERLDAKLKWEHQTKGSLPKGKVGPTPAKPCCEQTGGKCNDPAAWKNPIWKALDFAMEDPHLFRYSYESDDGLSFVATATGDLDCDGTEVTFTLSGKVESSGGLETEITPPTNRD